MRKTADDADLIVKDRNTLKVIPGVVTADDAEGWFTTVRMTTAYTMFGAYQTPVVNGAGQPIVDKHYGPIVVCRITRQPKK